MSIEQTEVVDFIGTDKKSGNIILTISDHLPWDKKKGKNKEHLSLLEKKISTYFHFVESGQLEEKYPGSVSKKAGINIIGKFPLSEDAEMFFQEAIRSGRKLNIEVTFKLFEE